MEFPEDLGYTEEHEWARVDGDLVTIGITDYAQDALGDVVFVQLPDTGDEVVAGEAFGEVESTKSVSDLYSPVSGEVSAVNGALEDEPELVNRDPYGEGWLVRVTVGSADIPGVMDAAAYQAFVEAGD